MITHKKTAENWSQSNGSEPWMKHDEDNQAVHVVMLYRYNITSMYMLYNSRMESNKMGEPQLWGCFYALDLTYLSFVKVLMLLNVHPSVISSWVLQSSPSQGVPRPDGTYSSASIMRSVPTWAFPEEFQREDAQPSLMTSVPHKGATAPLPYPDSEPHFGRFHLRRCSFGFYPVLMARMVGVYQHVN